MNNQVVKSLSCDVTCYLLPVEHEFDLRHGVRGRPKLEPMTAGDARAIIDTISDVTDLRIVTKIYTNVMSSGYSRSF